MAGDPMHAAVWHLEAPGDLRQGNSLLDQRLDSRLALGSCRRAADGLASPGSVALGMPQTGQDALANLRPLELGEGREQLHHEPALRRRHVDTVLHAHECHASRVQLRDRRQHVDRGTAPAIELPDAYRVEGAGFRLRNESLPGRSRLGARGFLLDRGDDLPAAKLG